MSAAYLFHTDPGHGWLQVPVKELRELGIEHDISNYSYLDATGQFAYLEEDCDMTAFGDAKGWARDQEVPITYVQHGSDCFIRGLRPYVVQS